MHHPVLFLTDENGKRTAVVIAIDYYNALLKKRDELLKMTEAKVSNETPISEDPRSK